MEFIVAVDRSFGIGKEGDLLYHIPEDLGFFRRTTIGHTVVMGRRTFESLPGRKALPDRLNIVLSTNPEFTAPGIVVQRSVQDLARFLQQEPSEKVFVMGGATLYQRLLPHCKGGYLTLLEVAAEEPDRFFPDVRSLPDWSCEGTVYVSKESEIPFEVVYYKNHRVQPLEVEP